MAHTRSISNFKPLFSFSFFITLCIIWGKLSVAKGNYFMPTLPLGDTVSEKKNKDTQGCCCFERNIIIFMCYSEHEFVQSQTGKFSWQQIWQLEVAPSFEGELFSSASFFLFFFFFRFNGKGRCTKSATACPLTGRHKHRSSHTGQLRSPPHSLPSVQL